jgi:uroporphyrinogen-III synthase
MSINNLSLQNKRILITRPQHQAATLCELIQQYGGEAVLLPTIAIEFITQDATLIHVLQNLAVQDIAIFISPNAVQATQALMQQHNIRWPKQLIIAAVGASTAKALTSINLTIDLMPSQFNSESLLMLPALQQVRNKQVIIFKGEGGRELLSNELCVRGAILTEALVYRRLVPAVDVQSLLPIWQAYDGLDIIVVTSNTGLQNLVTLLGDAARNWLMNMPLLVISKRTAQFAQELGFVKKPIVADNATDAAIVQALLNYYSR